MSTDNLSVSEHFVRAALSGAHRRGYDTRRMLTDAGISPELLQGRQIRVSGAQFTRLMQVIWTTLQDEYMGFASVRSKPGTFATACQLLIHCHTLESVYRRGAAFYNLFDNPVSVTLRRDGEWAILEIVTQAELFDPCHFLQESLLVIWHRLSCWLTGHRILLDQASFNYPRPGHADEYRHLFHCVLAFDQPVTSIRFHRRYLQLPVIRDAAEMRRFLQTSPADLLARPDDRSSFTGRIRSLIGRDFSQTIPDFDSIARQLHTSPQTLRRRLREENTSFQEIKDYLRRDLAIYYLSRPDYSINEIAEKVGFTEPSTFHRAFKKWTGVTPGAYREGEREG